MLAEHRETTTVRAIATAFVTTTIAWGLGLAVAVTAGMLLGFFTQAPVGTFAAPVILGLFVGWAQRRAAGRGWVSPSMPWLSAIGAGAGWLLGSYASFLVHRAGMDAAAGFMNGPVLGLIVGSAQALALPKGGRRAWISVSTLAWLAAITPWMVPGTPLFVRAASLLVPGIFSAWTRLWFKARA